MALRSWSVSDRLRPRRFLLVSRVCVCVLQAVCVCVLLSGRVSVAELTCETLMLLPTNLTGNFLCVSQSCLPAEKDPVRKRYTNANANAVFVLARSLAALNQTLSGSNSSGLSRLRHALPYLPLLWLEPHRRSSHCLPVRMSVRL